LAGRALDTGAERVKVTATETYDTLTGREREVLRPAAESLSAAEIAASLGISPRTAETRRESRVGKPGRQSRTDLIRWRPRRRGMPRDDWARPNPDLIFPDSGLPDIPGDEALRFILPEPRYAPPQHLPPFSAADGRQPFRSPLCPPCP